MRSALISLILEKNYDDITVKDILDRADVGRSTFYSHYRDKEDLFRGDWDRFMGLIIRNIRFENYACGGFIPIKVLFQHLADSHPLYRALEKSGKVDQLLKAGKDRLAGDLERELTKWMDTSRMTTAIPSSIMANYLANEIFGLLRWWLELNMPYTPERMDQIFHQLVAPGLRDAFDKE
jgi:AcrR family transcriptional regulator